MVFEGVPRRCMLFFLFRVSVSGTFLRMTRQIWLIKKKWSFFLTKFNSGVVMRQIDIYIETN